MKIITIIGTRPQFIKAATVSREIAKHTELKEIIVHTGQHFDHNMSNIFFEQMHLPKPDYNLNVNGLPHGAMTGKMLEGIEKVLLKEKPYGVLVYGDTNSTIAGALAAKKLHIKVAHVEAGLRAFNMELPEEINRILTDKISDTLFCPTEAAVKNLKKEGYNNLNCEIIKTGDVTYDAAMFYSKFAKKPSFDIPKEFILATIHRAENTEKIERLKNIIEALNEIYKKIKVVLPLHPRTRKVIEKFGLQPKFLLIEPVGYLEILYLLQRCKLVITDSGGLQKEAFFFHKPCITLRNETEWVELVQNNLNVLAGADKHMILKALHNIDKMTFFFNLDLYGNGRARINIINHLLSW